MPATRKPAKRRGATRDEIVDAVCRAIVKDGYARVNLQDVASALGISKGSIYYHVGSKEQVLYENIVSRYQRTLDRFDEILGYPLSAKDRLRLYLRERTRIGTTLRFEPQIDREAHYLTEEHRAEYIRLRDEHQARLVQLLEEGMASGEFRQLPNMRMFAFGILGLVAQFHIWYRTDGELTRDQVADLWWDQVCEGLVMRRGGESAGK
jgi:AcrR family transcriptional regulator